MRQGRRMAAGLVPSQACLVSGSVRASFAFSMECPRANPGPPLYLRSSDTHHPPAPRGAAGQAEAAPPPRTRRRSWVFQQPWSGRPLAGDWSAGSSCGTLGLSALVPRARHLALRSACTSQALRPARQEGGVRGAGEAGDAGAAALGPRTPGGVLSAAPGRRLWPGSAFVPGTWRPWCQKRLPRTVSSLGSARTEGKGVGRRREWRIGCREPLPAWGPSAKG